MVLYKTLIINIIMKGDVLMSSNKIVREFTKDVNDLQFKIEHRKLYNTRTFLIRFLIKSGMALNRSFPFILSSALVLNSNSYKENKVFQRDVVSKPGYIQSIDMSNGSHEENACANNGRNMVEYSTGWSINNQGLYERTVVSFNVNKKINLKNLDDILKMTEEELKELLTVSNVKTITQRELSEEDKMYDEDTVIVTQYVKSKDVEVLRQETSKENFEHSMACICSTCLFAVWFIKIKKFLIKTVIEDKLEDSLTMHRYIYEIELEDLENILETKKDNLSLLQNELQDKGRGLSRIRRR